MNSVLLNDMDCQQYHDSLSRLDSMEGIGDVEELMYHKGSLKKKYLGHMRFIGELYKGGLITLEDVLFCLNTLMKGYTEKTWNVLPN
jgi:hypothetical protein